VDQLTKDLQESRDETASLTLYVNRILARIMETNQPEMLASNEEEFRGERRRKSLQPGEQAAESGFEALKKHFRRASMSTTKKEDVENPDSTPEIQAAAAAMVERMRASSTSSPATQDTPPTNESSETPQANEGGIWRKALKRMSVGAWRSPALGQSALANMSSKNSSDISLSYAERIDEEPITDKDTELAAVAEHPEELAAN
jgi:hypothetical protein